MYCWKTGNEVHINSLPYPLGNNEWMKQPEYMCLLTLVPLESTTLLNMPQDVILKISPSKIFLDGPICLEEPLMACHR